MTSQTKKFLSPEQLALALAEIAEIAHHEGIAPVLIGGFAMQLYGSDRLTGDLDVAAATPISALPTEKTLSFGGQRTTAPSGVPVDVVVRDDELNELYNAAIDSAMNMQGVPVPVVSPDYLAAIKMAARRDRDTADLEFLILSDQLDLPHVRRIVKHHLGWYAAEEFDLIVDEARWKHERGLR
jgi:hypothetical protein